MGYVLHARGRRLLPGSRILDLRLLSALAAIAFYCLEKDCAGRSHKPDTPCRLAGLGLRSVSGFIPQAQNSPKANVVWYLGRRP